MIKKQNILRLAHALTHWRSCGPICAALLTLGPVRAMASGGSLFKETIVCGKGSPLVRVRLEEAAASEHRGEAFIHSGSTVRTPLLTQFDACYQASNVELEAQVPQGIPAEGLIVCGSEHRVRATRGGKSVVVKTTLGANSRGGRLFLWLVGRGASTVWNARLEGASLPTDVHVCTSTPEG